jgi:NADPH:quinone reductase-like Zn-dependent oxidoreductase
MDDSRSAPVKLSTMQALRFDAFGDESKLQLVEVPAPSMPDGWAMIAVEAAAINPSDVKNLAGRMRQTVPPRIPGRDYAGEVVAGPPEWVGAEVWGTGGDVGFTRDGTHAPYLAVPAAALSRKPAALSFVQAAAVGVNFVTAWIGTVEYAALAPGETIVIAGATGGVGGAVAQIARRIGARVIGATRGPPPKDSPIAASAEALIDLTAEDLDKGIARLTDGKGAAVIFDCVGGPLFEPAVKGLAHRGRLVCIAGQQGVPVSFDLIAFYRKEGRIFGADSLKRDTVACARILDQLRPGFEAGDFRPPLIGAVHPLADARAAYRAVAVGSRGKIVLAPGQKPAAKQE